MPENDHLDHDLAAIAEHARRTGRLESAAVLRGRADRRRRRRYATVSVLGAATTVVLGAGIAAARPDGGITTALPGTSSPSVVVSSAPAPSAAPSAPPAPPSVSPSRTKVKPATSAARPKKSEDNPGPLSGERQLFIFTLFKGEEVPESVVAVTKEQQVEITLDYGERALFVPVRAAPEGDEYVIKTGRIRSGGEAFCWVVQGDGTAPGKVVIDACDLGDPRQMITIKEAGKDNQDRMTYTLRNGDRYLTYDPLGEDGFAAQDLGGKDPESTYVFIDRGESTIPELG
jgi:hypothetical protein